MNGKTTVWEAVETFLSRYLVIPKAQYDQLAEPLRLESVDRFMAQFRPVS